MKFTVGQLREIIGLTPETFRHWNRVLPPLASRVGRSSVFSLGDLLSASVICHLTDRCGVRVGHLAQVAPKIFQLCNESPWTALEGKLLLINFEKSDCSIVRDTTDTIKDGSALIVCFLAPIILQLREALLRDQSPTLQEPLRFPLSSIDQSHPARLVK